MEAKRVVLAPPEDLPKKIPIANNPHVVNGLIDFPVAKNDSVPIMLGLPFIQPQIVAFKVVEIEPDEAVIITKNTSIEFSDKPAAGFEGIKRFSYEDIGGLKDELQRLREEGRLAGGRRRGVLAGRPLPALALSRCARDCWPS